MAIEKCLVCNQELPRSVIGIDGRCRNCLDDEEKDERRCHLCDGIEVDKYCVNKSCYEYIRYVKSIDFGKQDIRGTESITLIDHQSCVPYQKHFENKWEMLGFVVGYVNGATDSDYNLKAYKKEAEQ